MFPGEGGIDLVGLAKEMPRDITISIEVPTAELAKTLDAEARASRAKQSSPRRPPPELSTNREVKMPFYPACAIGRAAPSAAPRLALLGRIDAGGDNDRRRPSVFNRLVVGVG
jgi:hypothetical protein